ncbi:MAG: hypothetical protein V1707_01265 [bacterium]
MNEYKTIMDQENIARLFQLERLAGYQFFTDDKKQLMILLALMVLC